jgi:hypothetical protein
LAPSKKPPEVVEAFLELLEILEFHGGRRGRTRKESASVSFVDARKE